MKYEMVPDNLESTYNPYSGEYEMAPQGAQVEGLVHESGRGQCCILKAGHPSHPLYISYTQRPEVWT